MNPKKKIFISLVISISIILGLSPIFIIRLNLNDNLQDDNTQDERYGDYPSRDNPYYSQYYYYISGNLPSYSSQYDTTLKEALYYFDFINQAFGLSAEEIQLLEQNRFIVLNRMGTDDVVDAYSFYWKNDLPILITTDTILHVWHLIFDKILEQTEEDIFFPLVHALTIESMKNIKNYPFLEAQTIIYFNVALKIIDSNINLDLPFEIEQASEDLYNAIMSQSSPSYTELTRRFIDDYSQYKPRGHYTKSEILMKYFRLYKWLARIPFFFDDYIGYPLLQISPESMIKSAIEVTWILKNTTINYLDGQISGFEIWDTIMDFLYVIMGPPNSVTPKHIDSYCMKIIGNNWNLNNINEQIIIQVQNNILNDQAIPKPEFPFFVDILANGFESPKTFTLFGEIETLDGYAFQRVVHPNIWDRLLPHGLDFAFTCLDSNHSLELLKEKYSDEFNEFPEYEDILEGTKEEVKLLTQTRNESLQWNWISSLKFLAVDNLACDETKVLPEFMNSTVWMDEKLTTIMGSYAQLRHDTILYTKQSYGGIVCSTPTAFVEPYPDFYNSLAQLSQIYKTSFESLNQIGYNFDSGYFNFLRFLDTFTYICHWLESISIKELSQQPLTLEDKTFITSIYHEKAPDICGPSQARGWLPYLLSGLGYDYLEVDGSPNSRATLIADIHTDPNYGDVLHISSGFLEPIIAYIPSWDGHEIPVVGPVFSYYEFPAPNYNRLTDEEWRGILSTWLDGEDLESHNFDLIQRGFWAENYMLSTSITTDTIYDDYETYEPPSWF
ncbi:MAG: DUF3160 domain-containing protein [Candidatus Odinarchaeota archaeon]